MTMLSKAQDVFTNQILNVFDEKDMSKTQLQENLTGLSINLEENELNILFNFLKCDQADDVENLTQIDRYAKGHLF